MQLGMGWLGWTFEQTEHSTFDAIELAYLGRMDMVKAIFGSGDDGKAGSDNSLSRMKMNITKPEDMKAAFDFMGGKQMRVEKWPKHRLLAQLSESTPAKSKKRSAS